MSAEQHLLLCVCVLFVIPWLVRLPAMSGVQICAVDDDMSSLCSTYPTDEKTFGGLSDGISVFIHTDTIIILLLQTCTV
jgi:hypothetical protein